VDRKELVAFLRAQKWAVEATVTSEGAPQAAVIGVAVTDDLELIFDTESTSRKAKNLRANPKIALVIGWDDAKTVQYEGIADEPADREAMQRIYFARFPDGVDRAGPEISYFRVRPVWIRYSDFQTTPPTIRELNP
jgi:pyridoxine/pyridoxamine 5'-phosphate oxidase